MGLWRFIVSVDNNYNYYILISDNEIWSLNSFIISSLDTSSSFFLNVSLNRIKALLWTFLKAIRRRYSIVHNIINFPQDLPSTSKVEEEEEEVRRQDKSHRGECLPAFTQNAQENFYV